MPRTADTRKKILWAALDCFSEKGYIQSTMQDIADRVRIKAASIYNHFTGKEEILNAIFEYYILHFNKYRTPIDKVLEVAGSQPIRKVLPLLFYTFGTKEEHAVMMKMVRIVMDMKYENEHTQKLFTMSFIDEPLEYLHNVFSALIRSGKMLPFDFEALSFQMVSFAHMTMVMALMKGSSERELKKLFESGIALFSGSLMGFHLTGEKPFQIKTHPA